MTVAEGTLAGAALCAAETLRLAILLPAVQYLVGEAAVFDALRRRLPAILRTMAACPSCMGFWLGAGAGLLGVGPWAVGSTPWAAATALGAAGITGLAGVALTPMGRGLMALGWAVADPGAEGDGHGHSGHGHGGGDG